MGDQTGRLIDLLQEAASQARQTDSKVSDLAIHVAQVVAEQAAQKNVMARVEEELVRRIKQSSDDCARDHEEAMRAIQALAPPALPTPSMSGADAIPVKNRVSLAAIGSLIMVVLVTSAATMDWDCGASSRTDVPPASMEDLQLAPSATPEVTEEQHQAIEEWLRSQTPDALTPTIPPVVP